MTKQHRRNSNNNNYNRGVWSSEEKHLFLVGLQQFGRGHWSDVGSILTTRSTIQIKSHGQKMLRKADAGIDIFSSFRKRKTRRRRQSPTHLVETIEHLVDTRTVPRCGPLKKRSHRKLLNHGSTMEARALTEEERDSANDEHPDSFTTREGRDSAAPQSAAQMPTTLEKRDMRAASILCGLSNTSCLMRLPWSPCISRRRERAW